MTLVWIPCIWHMSKGRLCRGRPCTVSRSTPTTTSNVMRLNDFFGGTEVLCILVSAQSMREPPTVNVVYSPGEQAKINSSTTPTDTKHVRNVSMCWLECYRIELRVNRYGRWKMQCQCCPASPLLWVCGWI